MTMADGPETQVAPDVVDALRFQRYVLAAAGGAPASYDRRLIYLGSAPDCDLVVDDPTVSRTHARLEFDGVGYLLRDLASKNGTWVDNVRVREAYLPQAARIRLGHAEVAFSVAGEQVEVQLARGDRLGRLIGQSAQMREIMALIPRVAKSDVSVLIEGESGTGKELVAEAVQQHSRRADKPLVIFDCSAVAPELIESELFGHVKGAFTGAVGNREGVFAAAHGGTLFLDEIGELPLELQPKLLRVLERKEVKRLGSTKLLEIDVRVVAATHRDLPQMVKDGKFREDLYYRLAEVVVELPPLRDRLADVPVIAARILAEFASDGPVPELSDDAIDTLSRRPWSGNVRELRNVLKRAVVLASGPLLTSRDLALDAGSPLRDAGVAARPAALPGAPMEIGEDLPIKEARDRWVAPMEREYLVRIIKGCGADLDKAAEEAGIHRKSLERLLRQHGLKAADFR
ncbi:MAG: sigma 54-interacting transcriptional regulator [Myxococcales bacterium]|nr:sigma 54-interacting transcriptional regulator [Myxococcales bacterium]